MTVDAILKAVDALPAEERAELMQQIWERIAADGGVPELTDDLKAFLDERNAAADANPDDVYTWEQVLEYVRRKK